MLISYKNQFIFIHIFKTAWTAVSEGFGPYSRGIDRLVYGYRFTARFFNALNILMGRKGIAWLIGYRKHAKAEEVKSRLPDRIWNEYFTFAFVRNPWDGNVSLYFYLMGNKQLPAHQAVSNVRFSDHIKRRCAAQPAQQIDFIGDRDRNLLVDYVGRYESIQEDLDCICNRLHNAGPKRFYRINKFPGAFRWHKEQKTAFDERTEKQQAEEHYLMRKFSFPSETSLEGKYYRLRYRFAQLFQSLYFGGPTYTLKKFKQTYRRRGQFF